MRPAKRFSCGTQSHVGTPSTCVSTRSTLCDYFEYRTGYPTALTIGAYGSFVVRLHTRTHAQGHAQNITHTHPMHRVDDEHPVVHAVVEAYHAAWDTDGRWGTSVAALARRGV
jgi:hypothetical protein